MTKTGNGQWQSAASHSQTLLFGAFFLIPALAPSLLGWISGILAVPVFFLLAVQGQTAGIIILRNSVLLAGVIALLVGQIETFLFTLTLIPLGFVLLRSAAAKETAAVTGGKGILVLGITWGIFWTLFGMATQLHPYRHLVETLDLGFAQTLEFYQTDKSLPEETQRILQQVITDLRTTIPRILPGLLSCLVVLTVWINMVVSNALVARIEPYLKPWGDYQAWKLPEKLVWAPIVAAGLLLVGAESTLQDVALWLLLVSGVFYLFQGLAVFIALLERWRVPTLMRALLYIFLIVQSYGLIVLVFLGIGDVWFNLRRLPDKSPSATNDRQEQA